MHTPLQQYLDLIDSYNERKISTKQFEVNYLKIFKSDSEIKPEEQFKILDRLFSDVDAYTELPQDELSINEDQLRNAVKIAYSLLLKSLK